MERTCVIPNCRNKSKSNSNITYHVFPKNKVMKQKWIKAIRNDNFIPSKYSAVCSKHFEQKSFLKNKKNHLLRKDAVPSIFHDINNESMRNILQNQLSMNEAITPSPSENELSELDHSTRYLETPERRYLSHPERSKENISPIPSTSNGRASLSTNPIQSSSSESSLETEEESDFVDEYLDNIIFVDRAESNWTTARKYISKQGKQIAYLEQQNHYLNSKINKLYTSLRALKQKYENIQVTVVLNNN